MLVRFTCLLFLFSACGVSKPKPVSIYQIKRIYTDYNRDTSNLNVGIYFNFNIYAELKTGEIISLEEREDLKVSPNLKVHLTSKSATFTEKPTSFTQNKVPIEITLGNENQKKLYFKDTFLINFKNEVVLDYKSTRDLHGDRGKSAPINLLQRDGNHGRDGQAGGNGNNGDTYELFIWKESTRTFILCKNLSKNESYTYQVEGDHAIYLSAAGEDGGNGGSGGNGGDGNNGENSEARFTLPGSGGNGGDGGAGGNGGNGGEIICYIHPSAKDRIDFLKLNASGGKAGRGGYGGNGGNGGTPALNQQYPPKGMNGRDGKAGINGKDGTIERTIMPFDYSVLR